MRWIASAVCVSLLGASHAVAQEKPIIAVFAIEDRTKRLQPDQVIQLTDYFGVKITETGRYVVVPRTDVEAALKAAKVESYRACVDESCQIEIGKQLAAQKVLHTQIVQVGDACAVTSTLYDLRLAATERAASKKGGCDANALVESLEGVAQSLGQGAVAGAPPPAPPPKAAPPPPPKPAADTWALRVDSEPPGADVIVDGKREGATPTTIRRKKGQAMQLSVEAEGYEPYQEKVTLERDERRSVALRMQESKKRSRTEWFGGSVAGGMSFGGGVDFGLWLRFVNLHFGSLTLAPVEVFLGLAFAQKAKDASEGCGDPRGICEETVTAPHAFFGPRVGYKATFSSDHNIEVSLGGGLMAVADSDDQYVGPALGPTIRYLHLGDGAFSWGVGLRVLFPLIPKSCDNFLQDDELLDQQGGAIASYASCQNNLPVYLQLEVPLGGYF